MTGRAVYADCLVQNIACKVGEEFLELNNLEKALRVGEAVGDVDRDALKRLMICRTIEEHLDKELRLRPLGIKVLSLFFIDTVEHYRSYVDRVAIKGKYALIFEEEYRKAGATPKYRTLFAEVDLDADATRCTMATSRSTRKAPGPRQPRTTRAIAKTPNAPTT